MIKSKKVKTFTRDGYEGEYYVFSRDNYYVLKINIRKLSDKDSKSLELEIPKDISEEDLDKSIDNFIKNFDEIE